MQAQATISISAASKARSAMQAQARAVASRFPPATSRLTHGFKRRRTRTACLPTSFPHCSTSNPATTWTRRTARQEPSASRSSCPVRQKRWASTRVTRTKPSAARRVCSSRSMTITATGARRSKPTTAARETSAPARRRHTRRKFSARRATSRTSAVATVPAPARTS